MWKRKVKERGKKEGKEAKRTKRIENKRRSNIVGLGTSKDKE